MRPVCIQKCAGNIHDLFSSPYKDKSRRLGNDSNLCRFQILFLRICKELFHIFWIYHNSHTLLGFRDRDLCSVQSGIFFRYFIQIHTKPLCQLSDRNGNSACTEVITFFDQAAYLFPAEQTLDLTFCRRISFLNFRSACLDRLFCMYFGRSGRAAAAVTTGTSAQQNDNISRIGSFTDHCASRRCAKHCPDLHTFCHIIRMIDFFDASGRQTDLISVRTISVRCPPHQFLLRKFSFQCLIYGNGRICRPSHAHCLIYISTS